MQRSTLAKAAACACRRLSFSAVSISTSWRRRCTIAWRTCRSSSASGFTKRSRSGCWCRTRAKEARRRASRASVLASKPIDRAKSLAARGLTTATASPCACKAAAAANSYPPVASNMTSAGAISISFLHGAVMPASSLASRHVPCRSVHATSSDSLATSIPTNNSSDMSSRSLPCLCELEFQQPFGLRRRRSGKALCAEQRACYRPQGGTSCLCQSEHERYKGGKAGKPAAPTSRSTVAATGRSRLAQC